MGIEQELRQTRPFQNENEKALVNILYTHGWLKERLNAHFKQYDLTLQQYNILRILRGAKKPLTTRIIRERMIDRMSDISRLIERLIKKGFVIKEVSSYDKRLVDIQLSPKGQTVLERIDRDDQPLRSFLGELEESESKQLNHLLDKIRDSEQ